MPDENAPADPPAPAPPKLRPAGRPFSPKGRFGRGRPKEEARRPGRAKRAPVAEPSFLDNPLGWLEWHLWGPA